jgi:pimeloyl-ACP methyl ester carboxylesterase
MCESKEEKMTAFADVALTRVAVLDSTMAYREAGNPDSPTVLFLHGNPTSSYMWSAVPRIAGSSGLLLLLSGGYLNAGAKIDRVTP